MTLPINEQEIIISACCYCCDHYSGGFVNYSKKAIEGAGIEWNNEHESFVEWYLESWEGEQEDV